MTLHAAEADVIVVGAGLAGLACARALADAGREVRVLEARDRVGGRLWSREIGGARFDVGGQWMGAQHPRVKRLAGELGLETFPTFHQGQKVLEHAGRISRYASSIPRLAPWHLVAMELAMRRVDRKVRRLPDDPLSASDAAALDAQTIADVTRGLPSDAVRGLLAVATRVVLGAEPHEVSLLAFLAYVRRGGGLTHVIEIAEGAQETRFARGAQSLADGLAARLGDRVVLGAPVRAIEHGSGGVTVRAGDAAHRARRVVITAPPPLAARIAFDPPLPARRDRLAQRMPMGATIKCLAVYDRAFWRERGCSGEAVSTGGPLTVVFDNVAHGGRPCLVAFVVGASARALGERSPEERREAVLAHLARLHGPEAASPVSYVDLDWAAEPWSRGCPVASFVPGAMLDAGDALVRPVGWIHWAGTESATEHPGYMEGALESAERAATEVLTALSVA